MVEISLSELDDAADTIDALFECAFGEREMDISEMRNALEVADTLRSEWEFSQEPWSFDTGETVYDSHNDSVPLTVVGELKQVSGEVTLPNGETVAEYNGCPDDETVYAVRYRDSRQTYYFPECRIYRP